MSSDFRPPDRGDAELPSSADPNLITIAPVARGVHTKDDRPLLTRIPAILGMGFMAAGFFQGRVLYFFVGVFFFLVGSILIRVAIYFLSSSGWDEASLTLPRHAIRIGEHFTIEFAQRRNANASEVDVAVSGRVMCREWIRYSSGSSSQIRTATPWAEPLTLAHSEGSTDQPGARASMHVRLPTDAAPSFELRDNRVQWLIEVTLQTPGRPDLTHLFDFTVIPEFWNGDARSAPPLAGGFRPPSPGGI